MTEPHHADVTGDGPAIVRYQRTQRGVTIQLILLVVVATEAVAFVIWLLAGGVSGELIATGLALALVLLVVNLVAGSLTVTVTDEDLRLAMGVGLVRRTIPLGAIDECRAVRNSWWYGWGLRLTPRGWLWNVSGFDAVELAYRDGGHFRIGTAEPERLCAAIHATIGGDTLLSGG